MKAKIKKVFYLLTTSFLLSTSYAATNYVWQSSPSPTSPFTNWTTAAHVIQDAVDAANDGDLVLVTNGFYTAGGGLTPGFSLSNRVVITKSITLQSVNGPTNTLIVGQGPMGSNAVRCAYLTNDAEIIGFTMTNGHTMSEGNLPYERNGGGVFLDQECIISNSIICMNSAKWSGGGIISYRYGKIINCIVTTNIARHSAGISCWYGGYVDNCFVACNVAEQSGGGLSAGTIFNSIISNNYAYAGGGIYCYENSILSNLTIIGNFAELYGGGFFCNTNSVIKECSIKENKSKYGGSLHCQEGGFVNNCTINGNIAADGINQNGYGGGISTHNGGVVSNCYIYNNNSIKYGGGSYLYGSGELINCTIKGNSAGDGINTAGEGGGVFLQNGGTVNNCVIKENTVYSMLDLTDVGSGGGVYSSGGGTLNNCLISDNDAIYQGSEVGGVYGGTLNNCTVVNNYGREGCGGTSGGAVRNSIVYGNYNQFFEDNYCGGTYIYSCSTPLPGGEGNISNNPMFEYASTGNYHLTFGSPCINAGTNAYVVGDWDLDGNSRIVGGRVDMGCYESPIPEISVIGNQLSVIGLIFFIFFRRKSVKMRREQITKNVGCNYHKMSIGLFILFVTCYFPFTANAVTNYVWLGSPSPTSPYTNWSTAAHVIQDAVDAANDGDLVLVTNGNYTTGGGLTPGFSLSNRVVITKSITLQSVNGPTNTLIVGQGPMGSNAVRCAYLTNGAEIIGFTLTNGHTRNDGNWDYERGGGGVLLNDETLLTNCFVVGNEGMRGSGVLSINAIISDCLIYNNHGGGMFCKKSTIVINSMISNNYGLGIFSYYDNSFISCIISKNIANNYGGIFLDYGGTISNCTIIGNVASNFGGGFHMYNGGIALNCIIDSNDSKEGGGGYLYTKGQIINSKITKNHAIEYGGGIYLNSGGIVSNCTISGNSAGDGINTAGEGGGIYFSNGGTVNNCVIKENTIYSMLDLTDIGFGGGVYSSGGGTLNNCLISGNGAIYPGSEVGGVYGGTLNNCTVVNNYGREGCGGTSGGAVRNSIVYGNYNQFFEDNYCGGTYEYSCSTPLPTGEGNISNNPMFEYASTGNYHLAFGSPCINAGTNAFAPMPWDLDGNPRIVGGRVDMGCYEVPIPEISICSLQFAVCSLLIFNLFWRKS
ncbi:hypothetical protein KAH27_02110 [bacterium]|nr:hypothetical protein [bacterium]